jgi:hypothetical protein
VSTTETARGHRSRLKRRSPLAEWTVKREGLWLPSGMRKRNITSNESTVCRGVDLVFFFVKLYIVITL